MTDHVQTVHSDVAYINDLMLAGRRGLSRGGAIFVAAGAIYGAASLLNWSIAARVLPLEPEWQGWIWLAANAVFCPILYMQVAGLRVGGGSEPTGRLSRTVGSAWWSVSGAILALVVAFSAASVSLNDGRVWMGYSLSMFALYGMAWLVTAAAARRAWMAGVGLGSFGVAIMAGFLINSPAFYLLFAAGLIGLLAVPGLVLIRHADRPA